MSRTITLKEFYHIDERIPVLDILSHKLTHLYGVYIDGKMSLQMINHGQVTKGLLDECVADIIPIYNQAWDDIDSKKILA